RRRPTDHGRERFGRFKTREGRGLGTEPSPTPPGDDGGQRRESHERTNPRSDSPWPWWARHHRPNALRGIDRHPRNYPMGAFCRRRRRSVARAQPGPLAGTRIAAMTPSSSLVSPPATGLLPVLARGFRFSWQALLIIVCVNTGIAGVYWIEDPRPFWHPFVTVQCYGLSIAYCVNAAQPWDSPRPLVQLMLAVAR